MSRQNPGVDEIDADAVARIARAASSVQLAKERQPAYARDAAQHELCESVLAAHDLGISWQAIGDILDIRRGCAYQRFRRRSG